MDPQHFELLKEIRDDIKGLRSDFMAHVIDQEAHGLKSASQANSGTVAWIGATIAAVSLLASVILHIK